MNAQLVERDETAQPMVAQQGQVTTPSDLLRVALNSGADLDRLEKLYDMQQRYERDQARKAYMVAVAAFKSNPPDITKNKENKQYGSHYTTLDNLVNTTNASLAPHGLSANWNIQQSDKITVTCVLTHVLGHSEQVSMSGPPDTSGSKNVLQQIKSTVTYLRGATFEAVTGVASREFNADDDGNGATSGAVADWVAAIEACVDVPALENVGADLAKSSMSESHKKTVRKAYAVKLKALKS